MYASGLSTYYLLARRALGMIHLPYKYKLGTCDNSKAQHLIKTDTPCYCRGGTG